MPILTIETKENSAEKLAAIAGKETKFFLMAEEFNEVVEAVNEVDEKIEDHSNQTDNPHNVTKSQVGLSAVDNTSDINKPVSTAQATADASTLASAQTYAVSLITQIINGAPADADTLKELNDKIIALQAIVGGTTPDGDSVVNTVTELLAVFATFPEGVDLVALLAGKVNTADVYNALDCVVAGKVADARQLKVLNDLIVDLTVIVNVKEDVSNKSNDIDADKTSTSKYGAVKAIYDWGVAKFVQITNIKTVDGNSLIGTGNIVTPDMDTTTAQTVYGLKTFLNGMFGLRNVANTFTSFFTNSNTASRIYTYQDRNGTIADDTDLALKQNIAMNVQTITSSATVTPTSTNDMVIITAQAANLTLANATGTFQQGQSLIIRIKDNGTARTITYGSNYRAIGGVLPLTTTVNKTIYLGLLYNSTVSIFDIVAVKIEA